MSKCNHENDKKQKCWRECFNNQDKCILHCTKENWKQSDTDNIKLFWDEITKTIDSSTKSRIDLDQNVELAIQDNIIPILHKFDDVYFPSDNEQNDSFRTINKELKEDQKLDIAFFHCHFLEKIDFKYLFKAKDIVFTNCTFNEDVKFFNQDFKNVFIFQNCTVNKNIKFGSMTFSKLASFTNTTFKNKIDFVNTKFYDLALFNDCKLGTLNLDNTFFNGETNFLDMKNEDKQKLEPKNIANRETARIIKHSLSKLDNIIESNKYYAIEMDKRKSELEKNIYNNFFELATFKIHKISSNHSQDALLAFFWIMNIGFIASLFMFYTTQDECLNYIYCSLHSCWTTVSYLVMTVILVYCSTYNNKKIFHFLLLLGFYCIYRFTTNDIYLTDFANVINPFSIMLQENDFNLAILIFKVIFAYLIYQFVISIRQNTRRK